MPEPQLRDHPADRLIRELIETPRIVQREEIELILDRIATAPFDTKPIEVERFERGIVYKDRRVKPQDESQFVHLVRRVVLDEQWIVGTTAEQYVEDFHRAARVSNTNLAVYRRRGGSIAALLAPTLHAVPAQRRESRTLPELLVVYSADRGIIITGYQVVGRATISVPEDARLLR